MLLENLEKFILYSSLESPRNGILTPYYPCRSCATHFCLAFFFFSGNLKILPLSQYLEINNEAPATYTP